VGRVWFIGHSHIEGLDVTQVDPRGLNLGIGGETMAFTQARLADYPGLAFASAVVLAVGGNDVADVPASVMRTNARAIMNAIPEDVPVIWSLILPTDEKLQPSMTRARIATANAGWLDICAGRKRCLISDATPVLADNAGQLHTHGHIGDGEHLNEIGYAMWRTVLIRDLRKLQGRQP
jgi:lysophospholipase L1-like esterase